jgi:hypothetical protein
MLVLPRALLAASSLVLVMAAHGGAGDVVRHSGTIVNIDERTESTLLEEIGPWRIASGKTTLLKVAIAPDAPILLARRSARAPSGFGGDYVEEPMAPWGLAPGDFVTVECRHQGKRLVAIKVTVVDTPGPRGGVRGGS